MPRVQLQRRMSDGEDGKAFIQIKDANGRTVPDDGRVDRKSDQRDVDMSCGIGACRPKLLQNCKNMACFAASYSIAGIVTSALSVYVTSQITTLEKHFNFSSSVSGILMSCNDFGYLLTTLFASYYTRRLHIPRVLALSTIVYGISGLMCTLPFFGTRNQIPAPPKHTDMNVRPRSPGQLCDATNESLLSGNATCEEMAQRVNSFEISDEWRTTAVFIIAIGMMIQGLAKSPRQSFLATYVDDNVPKTKTTLYLGVMVGLAIFGPAMAFMLGGVFAKMYITLEETTMSPRDPRWLGAWWLGFLMFGAMGLISGLPLIFFPKKMRRQKELEEIEKIDKQQQRGQNRLLHDAKGFFRSLGRIICSPVYTCMVVGTAINLMGIAGMIAFLPKYLETQFTLPAWKANFLLGAVNIASSALGTVIGGCVTSRFKLSPLACLKMVITCTVLSLAIGSLSLVIGCDQPVIHKESVTGLSDNSCTSNCHCDDRNYFPVCGSDNYNYFSPCHAGCTAAGARTFTNCSCLSGNVTLSQPSVAMAGLCETDCQALVPYISLTFFAAFIACMVIMPGFVVNIRSVTEKDKPLAIGLSAFISTLIGWFPGPVVFGALVDTTCLIWKTSCSTTKGACQLYDIEMFRFRFNGVQIALKVVTLLFMIVAFIYATCSSKVVFQPHKDEESDVLDNDGYVLKENQRSCNDTEART